MTDKRYSLTNRARIDLEDIWLYTKDRWSIDQADRYLRLIYNEFEFLTKNPKSGQVNWNNELGYRSSRVKSHSVFYREQNDGIVIVRVLHSRMDIFSKLMK
jgi:toxin ParE1/3/4